MFIGRERNSNIIIWKEVWVGFLLAKTYIACYWKKRSTTYRFSTMPRKI